MVESPPFPVPVMLNQTAKAKFDLKSLNFGASGPTCIEIDRTNSTFESHKSKNLELFRPADEKKRCNELLITVLSVIN